MSKQTRYLLTVDSATGAAVKLERLGEAGDLTEVPLSTLAVAIPGAQPMAGAAPPASQPLVINIYMGGPQQAAPLSVSVPGLVGPGAPGGPGAYATLTGPGAPGGPGAYATVSGPGAPGGPGQVSLFSVAEARAASAQLQGPGGPGVTTTAVQGPGGPGGTTGGTEGDSR
jgi:hypothetical protein